MSNEISQRMVEIAKQLPAINKKHNNSAQNYKFRSITDIMNDCSEVISNCGVVIIPTVLRDKEVRTEQQKHDGKVSVTIDRVLKVQWRFMASDGSFVDAITMGEGRDTSDKSLNKAFTSAYKNLIEKTFMLSYEESDSEKDHIEITKQKKIEIKKEETISQPMQQDKQETYTQKTQSRIALIKEGKLSKDGQPIPYNKDTITKIKNKLNEDLNTKLVSMEEANHIIENILNPLIDKLNKAESK